MYAKGVNIIYYIAIQWNLPYQDLFYPGTSIVWTVQMWLLHKYRYLHYFIRPR